jgi:hypothetical protein
MNNAAVAPAYTTHWGFDKLPKEFRESLLVKLADIDTAAGEVGDALLFHFENLSEEVKLNLNIREQMMFKRANIYDPNTRQQLEQKLSSFYKVS